MATLEALAERIEKLAKTLPRQLSDTVCDAALDIVSHLAIVTPVDTSLALSNWTVTFDGPASGTIPPHVLGSRGSSYGASYPQTISDATAMLMRKNPGHPVFITNSVDYISDLNQGASRQEPAGFVERAVLIGRKKSRATRLRV